MAIITHWKCGQDVIDFIALLSEKGVCPNARNSSNELTRHYLGFEIDDNIDDNVDEGVCQNSSNEIVAMNWRDNILALRLMTLLMIILWS